MCDKIGKSKMSQEEKNDKQHLTWRDYIAIIIAMLTTTLFPLLIFLLILIAALIVLVACFPDFDFSKIVSFIAARQAQQLNKQYVEYRGKRFSVKNLLNKNG
jgi:hypothetical protein